MPTSLLPERPLIISPTLAATIGLEEAVMLQALADFLAHKPSLSREGQGNKQWVRCTSHDIAALFPFWAPIDVRRNQRSLQTLGLIKIESVNGNDDEVFITIDECQDKVDSGLGTHSVAHSVTHSVTTAESSPKPAPLIPAPAITAKTSGTATLIPPNWQPDTTWIQRCLEHNIPENFIRPLVGEFVAYWRDRAQARFSWGNAFYKHVLREWRKEEVRNNKYEISTEMSQEWRPSQDAVEILVNSGVSASFLEDAIPEFVLYWRERGLVHGAWNTKFIEHIRRQWGKFSASFGLDDTPKMIPLDWHPSADCLEILALAEIDEVYARGKVAEFVLYWRDSQQVKASWNTVFLQFIKQDWARRLKSNLADNANAENESFAGSSQQRIKERFEQIADRSWAD